VKGDQFEILGIYGSMDFKEYDKEKSENLILVLKA
jgi:hypothetical protein